MTWLNGRGILMRDARGKELRNRRTMMSVRWRPINTTWRWCEVWSGYGRYLKTSGSTEWTCGNKKLCSISWGFADFVADAASEGLGKLLGMEEFSMSSVNQKMSCRSRMFCLLPSWNWSSPAGEQRVTGFLHWATTQLTGFFGPTSCYSWWLWSLGLSSQDGGIHLDFSAGGGNSIHSDHCGVFMLGVISQDSRVGFAGSLGCGVSIQESLLFSCPPCSSDLVEEGHLRGLEFRKWAVRQKIG